MSGQGSVRRDGVGVRVRVGIEVRFNGVQLGLAIEVTVRVGVRVS